LDSFTLSQRIAYKTLLKILKFDKNKSENIITTSFKAEATTLFIIATTTNQELSKHISELLYVSITEFYINQRTSNQESTFSTLKNKTDSIHFALQNAESKISKRLNMSRGLVLPTDQAPNEQLKRKIEMLYIMYGESLKNLNTADYVLRSNTPIFIALERPILPLAAEPSSKLKALIYGLVLGFLISSLFFVGRHIVQDALRNES
jgi:hypothetical protein